jgi:hypothetical protein
MVHSPFSNIDYLKLRNAMSTPGGGVSNIEHISFNEIAVRMSRSPGAARVLWTRDRAKGVRNRKTTFLHQWARNRFLARMALG